MPRINQLCKHSPLSLHNTLGALAYKVRRLIDFVPSSLLTITMSELSSFMPGPRGPDVRRLVSAMTTFAFLSLIVDQFNQYAHIDAFEDMSDRLDHLAWRVIEATYALHDWLEDRSLHEELIEIIKARFGNGLIREMVRSHFQSQLG